MKDPTYFFRAPCRVTDDQGRVGVVALSDFTSVTVVFCEGLAGDTEVQTFPQFTTQLTTVDEGRSDSTDGQSLEELYEEQDRLECEYENIQDEIDTLCDRLCSLDSELDDLEMMIDAARAEEAARARLLAHALAQVRLT